MNNNTIKINSYLQNEMSAEERKAFEAGLVIDAELRNELKLQQQITDAAFSAGLKMEFTKLVRKKMIRTRVIRFGLLAAAIVGLILLFNSRQLFLSDNSTDKKNVAVDAKEAPSKFINPPSSKIDIPFTEYSFDAAKGATVFTALGSVIYFPPSAMLDESGDLIKGPVNVRYREFTDPVDFFVSGIPMGYDSAGVKYNFESSGMCEINAYQNNKAVFVNPKAKPQVYLSGTNKDPAHNLYYLDTAKRSWNYMGKDRITVVTLPGKMKTTIVSQPLFESEGIPVKPLKPLKASDDHQSFSIEIVPGSFEELFAYDGLKFEVVDETTYHPSDAAEHWDNVSLDRGTSEGVYTVTFTNSSRKVSYKVRPVLADGDYDAALKVFNEKNKAYELALKTRITRDQATSDSMVAENKKWQATIKAETEENDRINALIVERNKKRKAAWEVQKIAITKMQAEMQTNNAKMQAEMQADNEKMMKQLTELQLKQQKEYELLQTKYSNEAKLSGEIIRSFSINSFGIWNCDHPIYNNQEIPLYPSFTDSDNNGLNFRSIAVVYRGFNGLMQFAPQAQIRVIPGKDNMIWAIEDSSFYYYSYKDFREAVIKEDTRVFNFKMRKAVGIVSSYAEIKKLAETL